MKKVVSLLLTVAMLFGICAVSGSAAIDDATMAYIVETEAGSYAKGDIVTFVVSFETGSELAGVHVTTAEFGYDSNVFEPIETVPADGLYMNAFTSSPATVEFDGYALGNGQVDASGSFVQIKGTERLNSVDTSKGYNSVIKLVIGATASAAWVDCSSKKAMFAFNLRLKEDAPDNGCYTVGLTDFAIQSGTTTVTEELGDIAGPSGLDYGFSTSKIFDPQDATVKAAAPAVVFHNKVQVQWANEAENTINLGFKGYFKSADIGITFDGNNKAENVTAVGAEVTGAKTATGVGKYVFTPDDGTTYYFRGVIEGLDLDDSAQANTPITVRYFVVYNGETLYSDPVPLKTAAEYAEVLKK